MKPEMKTKILDFIKPSVTQEEFDNFKDLLENKYDTTTEIFYDLKKENDESICILEYVDQGKLGYSIQVKNCNVWLDEKTWWEVVNGILLAVDKLKKRNVDKFG